MNDAMQQWTDRAETSVLNQADDQPAFWHVPFQSVVTRQVRYTEVGPLPPRQFEFDD
jgi:hypothetical protein